MRSAPLFFGMILGNALALVAVFIHHNIGFLMAQIACLLLGYIWGKADTFWAATGGKGITMLPRETEANNESDN
jgi:hypothetical protein